MPDPRLRRVKDVHVNLPISRSFKLWTENSFSHFYKEKTMTKIWWK